MNPEIKQKWVTALLSGKYEQGQHYLVKDNKYCCLGVLRDVIEPGSLKIYGISSLSPEDKSYLQKTSYLHADHDGGLKTPDLVKLAALNDGGSSFKQIAEYIQNNH